MTSKPAGNTPNQGADRSAFDQPREVRGDLIERLRKKADYLRRQHYAISGTLIDEAATALAAQDARIAAVERVLTGWREKLTYLEGLKAANGLTKDWGECSLTKTRRVVEELDAALKPEAR